MDIQFPYIPDQEVLPLFQMDVATDNPAPQTQRTLIIGQTITAQPAVPVLVNSVARAVKLFGSAAQITSMVQRYKASDPDGEVWCLPLVDAGGGVAAAGSIDFTGASPTENGNIYVYIAGRYLAVPVSKTDNAAGIATNVAAAINAYVDSNDFHIPKHKKGKFATGVTMPVTAVAGGVGNKFVNLTALNKGTPGNDIDVQINYLGPSGNEALPNGVPTPGIVSMTGGSGDPDISGIDGTLGDTAYDFIISPWNTTVQLDLLKTLMANDVGHWSWSRQVYGHVFSAVKSGQDGSTGVTFGTARNDPHCTVVCYETSMPVTTYDLVSWFTGAFAVASRSDPARPVQGLVLPGCFAPNRHRRFSTTVRTSLLNAGLATLKYDADNTVRIERAVTTYKYDANAARDYSYRDTETLFTVMAVVRQQKSDLVSQFPRAKLAADGTNFGPGSAYVPGQPDQVIATPKIVAAAMVASYQRLIVRGLVQDVQTYASLLRVQLRSTDPSRLDILNPVILIGGLRVMAVLTNFALASPN